MWFPTTGAPVFDQPVALTIAGMFHAGTPITDGQIACFVGALAEAVTRQKATHPTPTSVVNTVVRGATITEAASHRTGISFLTQASLKLMLQGEPPTRIGLGMMANGRDWTWTLDDLRLKSYRKVTTGEEYLGALEEFVGLRPQTMNRLPLPNMAVPEAFDHLDLAWRVAFNQPLLAVHNATGPAILTQRPESADEFYRRCSALATIIEDFATKIPQDSTAGAKGKKSLIGMKATLKDRLGDGAQIPIAGVDTLRNIVAIRNGQQHHDDADARRARQELGLATFADDWGGAWEHLRHVLVDNLRKIREGCGLADQHPLRNA
jgi:hypothetical protein